MALTEKYVTGAGAGAHDGSSLGNAFSWAEMITDINATGKAGNRYNFNGSVSRTTTTDTLTSGGSATSPVIIRGYNSVITDGYQGMTSGLLNTSNMPSISYTTGKLTCSTGTFIMFENLAMTSAASAGTLEIGTDCAAAHCSITNSSTNALARSISLFNSRALAFDCDAFLTGASGGSAAISALNVSNRAIACRAKVISTCPGIRVASTSVVINCIVYGSGGIGIAMDTTNGSPTIFGNTIYGCAGDGINIVTGTTVLQCIIDNMSTDNTGDGLDMVSTGNAAFLAYLRTRDNGGSAINNSGDWITATNYGAVTSGAGTSDYVNAGSLDFTPKTTSPATSAGYPINTSIGAIQRSQTGSGGGIKTHPGMTGGILG